MKLNFHGDEIENKIAKVGIIYKIFLKRASRKISNGARDLKYL